MRVRLGGSSRRSSRGRSAGRAGGHGARPAPGLRLPAAYDLLDVPAAAGHRVLLQLERLGMPLGPVLTVQAGGEGHAAGAAGYGGGGRLRFFVEAGTTASFLADLKDLGWDPDETDIRAIGVVLASETVLPPAGSPRWVRAPETVADTGMTVRPVALPPARLLLGALAYACRRAEGRRGCALFAACRAG